MIDIIALLTIIFCTRKAMSKINEETTVVDEPYQHVNGKWTVCLSDRQVDGPLAADLRFIDF
jgi:hypothetical protein